MAKCDILSHCYSVVLATDLVGFKMADWNPKTACIRPPPTVQYVKPAGALRLSFKTWRREPLPGSAFHWKTPS